MDGEVRQSTEQANWALPFWKFRIAFIFAGTNGPFGWDDAACVR